MSDAAEFLEPRDSSEDPIDLLNAVRTAFAKDSDPEMFLARASDQIREVESAIVETCAKNRIRTDDNLYSLLESRDAIAEQSTELKNCKQTAADISVSVNDAQRELHEKIQVRKNLDSALAIAAHTRRIVRMFARTEDIIDAQRLYTAFCMLKTLEDDIRSIRKGTVIEELVPDTQKLRTKITMQARKGVHNWLNAVRKFEHVIGEYALYHARAQAVAYQCFLESCRVSSAADRHILPYLPPATGVGAWGKPWIPLLTTRPNPVVPASHRRSRTGSFRSPSIIAMPMRSASKGGSLPAENSLEKRRSVKPVVEEYRGEIPALYLRPLLQSVQVNKGMDLLTDMQSEYRRERLEHLHNVFEDTSSSDEDPFAITTDAFPIIETLKTAMIEETVCKVCGFFVVERAVENYAATALVPRAVVDEEWWPWAYGHLNLLLGKMDKSSEDSAVEKDCVRSIRESVIRFARANELST
ncbi:Exocyst complex component EXOC6/Sec15 [Gracilaria domingensis]|nr:Exocyst complex component EXOC6/Sec15 [Gracilaria domingensis]